MLMRHCVLLLCFLTISVSYSQRRVDPRLTYFRVITVVPHVGAGTAADPKRPQYAPPARTAANQPIAGIIGFTQQISDDGKWALVEYVAKDMVSLQTILNDKTIK